MLPISLLLRAALLLPMYSNLFDENAYTPTATAALAVCTAAAGVVLIIWELATPAVVDLAAGVDAEAQARPP